MQQKKQPKLIAAIVSGGQTGADRAGLDAALAAGLSHGGWCPRGRLAEDGVIPRRYHLEELEEPDYAARTKRNVADSDATLIFTFGPAVGGSAATIGYAIRLQRPWLHLDLARQSKEEAVAKRIVEWLKKTPRQPALWRRQAAKGDRTLPGQAHPVGPGLIVNIAGSRASGAPEIYSRVRAILENILRED